MSFKMKEEKRMTDQICIRFTKAEADRFRKISYKLEARLAVELRKECFKWLDRMEKKFGVAKGV